MSSFTGDFLCLDDFESLGENFPDIEIDLNFDHFEIDKTEIPDILLHDIFFDTPISVEKSQEVHVRTHRGSGSRTITLDMLKRVGHLPQQKAADALKIGNTRFKTATRQLGMSGWPYRKIKSIQNLIKIIEQHTKFFGEKESSSIIEKLRVLESTVFHAPDTPLSEEFKKFRQAAYKLTSKRKKRKWMEN